jgi:hypothetical protein
MEVVELLTNYFTPKEVDEKIKEFIRNLRIKEGVEDETDEDYLFTRGIFEEIEEQIKDI